MKTFGKRLPYTLAIAATFWSATSRADVTYTESSDDKPTIVRMNVTPAAEPMPALKYRLLARDIDLQSGNAAPYYYRAFLEMKERLPKVRKLYGDDFDNWYATSGEDSIPLDKLPLDKVREADSGFDFPIETHIVPATSRHSCDWQLDIEDVRGPALIEYILDDFQAARDVSKILSLRTRLAVAEGRYNEALVTMRMNYRLAVDTARAPLLVCGLIAIAEASMANGTVTELIAAPNSPNLYWALSELPQPLIDLRSAARFELEIGPRIFPYLQHAETADHAPQEWNRLYTAAVHDLSTLGSSTPVISDVGTGLAATAFALVGYPHAKAQLIAQGMDRDKVEQMAVGQVMAIYTERSYQRFADDYQKLWYVPFWQMNQATRNLDQQLSAAKPLSGGTDRELLPIASVLLPAIQAARASQVRLERDIAALRVIEALRMYAANHTGQLPETLDDIREVPIPLNPATGKPFMYHLEGDTAVLVLPHSDGLSRPTQQFEIKIVQGK